MINLYIYREKNEAADKNIPRFSNNKKMLFDMVKGTNSSPIFQESRAKNVCFYCKSISYKC
jgi:hypothetical protein